MDDFYNLFRSSYHPFYTNKYECVIYGEGGKHKLFVNVILPLVNEVFGYPDCNKQNHHRFFVVVDADGEPPTTLCNNYYEAITQTLKSKSSQQRFDCKPSQNGTCFEFFSPKDPRGRCFVKTSHIPISLEKELVSKGCEKKIRNNRKKFIRDLHDMEIHKSLDTLASELEISVDQLIQMSVREAWFADDPWYQEITRNLASFI
jgi:hypothetical protein